MRSTKNFSGFYCGQFMTPNGECCEGVMEYANGQQVRFHVPKKMDTAVLYARLKNGGHISNDVTVYAVQS